MTSDGTKPDLKTVTAALYAAEAASNQSSMTLSTTETTEAVPDESNLKIESDPAKSSEGATPIDEAPLAVSFSPTSKDEEKGNEEVDGQEHEEEAEEELTSLEEVYDALASLSSPGSTCTGGVATQLPPIPGLVVEGVGDISLPLSPECAEKLKKVASQAPHGRGMETIIDTAVRNTLQVDAEKVRLLNPAWPAALRALTRKVSVALGVNADLVRPEMYKLLLYETGGFFKKHRDTEKAEGMFATLVIQLPSRFTGGNFIVSHNGKSETFSLEQPKTAPFNCHYVGHYADCEHEILPVESGHRLALIYSLCYTGNEVSKPSLADLKDGSLVSVMKRLNPSESLFAVPLEHQYTSLSLARLGVGALKGDDRALAQTISRVDGWEMVVATAQRTDYESGSGGHAYYDYFEVHDTEEGDATLTELFHQDGGDARAHGRWLGQQLDFCSWVEGGKMLASEDECTEMWGDGDSGEVEYTGNEGATRETTYTTCILIAFSSEGVFERLCQADFSDALAETQRNPILVERLLKHIKQSKQGISSENFLKLHQLIEGKDSYWESVNVIFQGLPKSDVPASGVFSILTSLIKELGWNHEKVAPMRLFLEQLPNSVKNTETRMLVPLIEGLLSIKNVVEDKSPVAKLLQTAATQVEANIPSSTYPTFSYRYASSLSIVEVCERLKSLSSLFGWEDVGIFVRPFFVRIRKSNSTKKSVDTLAEQITALASISAHVPSADVEFLQQSIMDDFIGLVEAKSPSSQSSYYRHSSATNVVWKSSKINIVARELILHGTPALFRRLEAWASTASLSAVSDADSVLQQLKSNNIQPAHAAAKDKLIDYVHRRCCELRVAKLKNQENTLLQKTQGGQPVFSWSMPNAKSGDSALDDFLRGSQTGPLEIGVGGGINGARQLAGRGRYGTYGYSVTPKELINRGYSAEIRNTNKTGRNASVIVTKTKQLYNAEVNEYNLNIKTLTGVRAKLEKLGHRSSQPAQQPAAKRPKPDPEVIVID